MLVCLRWVVSVWFSDFEVLLFLGWVLLIRMFVVCGGVLLLKVLGV